MRHPCMAFLSRIFFDERSKYVPKERFTKGHTMKPTLLTAVALTALIAAPAHAADTPESKSQQNYQATDNGGFKASDQSEATDASGTTVTHETTKKVDVDSRGNTTTTVDIKKSEDPKGLFNKSTTEVENKAVQKDGKAEYIHKKIVNGKTVEKTDDVQEPSK